MKIERLKSLSLEVEIGDIVRYRGCQCMIVKQRYPGENGFPYGILNLETNEVENNFKDLESLSKAVVLIQKSENIIIKF